MVKTISYSPPVLLAEDHVCEGFDCGSIVLNEWLRRYALQNQQANAARTFVVCQESRVVAYYSLAVGAVDYSGATDRVRKGLARHPIPVMVLARLAVDIRHQGKKIGRGLLRDACLRTLQAADIAGIRALFVHAKDERARAFYERFGFEPSPIHRLQLMLLIKDIKKTILSIRSHRSKRSSQDAR
jgi:predicted N-acetyltransferase YhbS